MDVAQIGERVARDEVRLDPRQEPVQRGQHDGATADRERILAVEGVARERPLGSRQGVRQFRLSTQRPHPFMTRPRRHPKAKFERNSKAQNSAADGRNRGGLRCVAGSVVQGNEFQADFFFAGRAFMCFEHSSTKPRAKAAL